ncbi:MAG: hypothetical protein IIC99_00810 [Chloroflexi bacterium]|nr:hypothetical protein [Chloroflexota bacterium]
MGLVKVVADIGLNRDGLQEIEFLVDAGSFYTFLPTDLAESMGIDFPVASRVVLADSREADIRVGVAYLRLEDREGGIMVANMNVPMPLLGASALEILGLKVDPVNEVLEHSRPFGPSALAGLIAFADT